MKQEYLRKEKNLFTFYDDEKDAQTPYALDINSGVFYGKKGRVLKRQPKPLRKAIAYILENSQDFDINMINMAIVLNNTINMELLSIADKMASLGYELSVDDIVWRQADLEYISKHFKLFAKSYRENPELTIREFSREMPFKLWLQKNNLKENDYITLNLLEVAYEVACYTNRTESLDVNLLMYYLTHGLYEYSDGYSYQIKGKIDEYMLWCNTLHIKPKKDCFMRTYAEMKVTYNNFIDKNNNKILKDYQENHHLEFETEKYKVIVPVTKNEFIQEANNQNNCVFRIYYPRVLENDTNVVFIRDKQNLEKSLITCEVRKGVIIQYLLKNNRSVQDTELLEFKKSYQEYLQENYK